MSFGKVDNLLGHYSFEKPERGRGFLARQFLLDGAVQQLRGMKSLGLGNDAELVTSPDFLGSKLMTADNSLSRSLLPFDNYLSDSLFLPFYGHANPLLDGV